MDKSSRQVNEKEKSYNYSIAFMKAFFSFLVVCCHYWTPKDPTFYPTAALLRLIGVAVPVFVITSFFLTAKIYQEQDFPKLKKRLWRLAFPYVIWGVVYFAGYSLIDLLIKQVSWKDGLRLDLTVTDLLWQLGLGSSEKLCPQLWYSFVLIVMTVVIWLLFKLGQKYTPFLLAVLSAGMFVLQYTGLNFKVFGAMRYEMRYPLGRLCEMLPFVCLGILLAMGILQKLSQRRVLVAIGAGATLLLIGICGWFTTMPESFTYGGIFTLLYGGLAFLFFYMLPMEKLPEYIRKILKFLARYSFGVFCIHFGVGYLWNAVLCRRFGWQTNTMLQCLVIYAISLLVSFLISRIPGKLSKQLVE